MGRYVWRYKSPNMGYKYSYLTYNLTTLTTHEPPSRVYGPSGYYRDSDTPDPMQFAGQASLSPGPWVLKDTSFGLE